MVVLANSAKEIFAPSEEADADFAKELAKMMSDTSGDSRKVDKKTALALWESNVLPQGVRKKRDEAEIDDSAGESVNTMNFTIVTKRGNKQQVRKYFKLWVYINLKLLLSLASLRYRPPRHWPSKLAQRRCKIKLSNSTSNG